MDFRLGKLFLKDYSTGEVPVPGPNDFIREKLAS
jgi:hypothetical protein